MTADVTDRTLYTLAACASAKMYADSEDVDEVAGPPDSSWADLLAAIMEGFERGWVKEARLFRERGQTHMVWRATSRGDRAIWAYRRRA